MIVKIYETGVSPSKATANNFKSSVSSDKTFAFMPLYNCSIALTACPQDLQYLSPMYAAESLLEIKKIYCYLYVSFLRSFHQSPQSYDVSSYRPFWSEPILGWL